MELWKIVLIAVMVIATIATWGSVGSGLLLFGLVFIGLGLVKQHFSDPDDPNGEEYFK